MGNFTLKNKINFSQIKKEILDAKKKKLEKILEEEAGEIVRRTQAGKDINNSNFKAYSEGYEKYKTKKGRSRKPDLTFTGKMLNAITSKVEQLGNVIVGKIFFNSVAEGLKARFNSESRDFFGLSKKQEQRIIKKLNEEG